LAFATVDFEATACCACGRQLRRKCITPERRIGKPSRSAWFQIPCPPKRIGV